MGDLYIVATPIGNLEDITYRAVRILRSVDRVFCEDTRVTKKLLNHYSITVATESLNSFSEEKKSARIAEILSEGRDVALVSDAGTPTISDPGSMLVARVREMLPSVKVITIPGPSAVVAALSISGLPSSDFLFLGFLPHKKGRETLFKEIEGSQRTTALYESPHRLMKTLERITLFEKERRVVVVREATKIFEEVVSGSSHEVFEHFSHYPSIKGELVVLIEAVRK